jgi:hypothetical protein
MKDPLLPEYRAVHAAFDDVGRISRQEVEFRDDHCFFFAGTDIVQT